MLNIKAVNEKGPSAAHHAAIATREGIFVHGGVISHDQMDTPVSTLWRFDPCTSSWTNVNDDGPTLSHHTGYQLDDRYLIFVGGWTGKIRTSEVHVYDTKINTWLELPPVAGFPVGGGLSSHTLTVTETGYVYVVGRLGGTLTQRKSGSSLKLTGHPSTGFKYEEFNLDIPSMSGHTATPLKSSKVVLIGGRSEPHRNMQPQIQRLSRLKYCQSLSLHSVLGNPVTLTGKHRVASRRYHVTVGDKDGLVLLHGGQGFSELKSVAGGGVMNSAAIYVADEMKWRSVKLTSDSKWPRLSGHSATLFKEHSSVAPMIYLLGGFGQDWAPNRITYQLKVETTESAQ